SCYARLEWEPALQLEAKQKRRCAAVDTRPPTATRDSRPCVLVSPGASPPDQVHIRGRTSCPTSCIQASETACRTRIAAERGGHWKRKTRGLHSRSGVPHRVRHSHPGRGQQVFVPAREPDGARGHCGSRRRPAVA